MNKEYIIIIITMKENSEYKYNGHQGRRHYEGVVRASVRVAVGGRGVGPDRESDVGRKVGAGRESGVGHEVGSGRESSDSCRGRRCGGT